MDLNLKIQRYSVFSNLKKEGIFKIKAPSNFRGKNWRKIGKVDICTNPFEKKLPVKKDQDNLKAFIFLTFYTVNDHWLVDSKRTKILNCW